MAEVTAKMVKELRERSGAGIMDCKTALKEAGGDLPQAELILRKRGIAVAQKKASRAANEGAIGTYIHPGSKLGVLVEVNCETDFVARTDDFQQLLHDVAMHIAAADPQFIRKEDISEEALENEKQVQRARALQEGKPEQGDRQDYRGPDGQVLRRDLLARTTFRQGQLRDDRRVDHLEDCQARREYHGQPLGAIQGRGSQLGWFLAFSFKTELDGSP